ncbi:vegetative cell wall protein gp1 [Drosophila subobscura]|uniref:vegetative cell wall protein gp1 n=1 Tax=Drosophila subobscura TaxID=7241 RepID=UPI00155B13E4|nr:vegetative cell wall protein gp1 [Drosophila subobscura]
MSTTISVALLCALLAQLASAGQQQLLLARPQRSSLFDGSPPLDPFAASFGSIGQLAAPGWNSVTPPGGEWAYNPIGLGHMSKDELVTLLDAWREVEQEAATSPAPEPVETTTKVPAPPPPAPMRPRPPPPPPPPPRPLVLAPAANPLPPGTPVTVRLPAFVPVRLAAMFTPPAAAAPPAAAPGDDLDTDVVPDEEAMPRLFRFMQMAPSPRHQQQQQQQHQFVVRNTLDSIEAGTSPTRNRVKPSPRAAQPQPQPQPLPAPQSAPAPVSAFRPRFGMPPHMANARFELVPSSQIIGEWRE